MPDVQPLVPGEEEDAVLLTILDSPGAVRPVPSFDQESGQKDDT